MGLLTTLLTGFALAMDAFAVSVTKGMTLRKITPFISFKIAFSFGLFQGLMPFIGWFIGVPIIYHGCRSLDCFVFIIFYRT